MAEFSWAVLAQRVIVDEETKLVSIVDILDAVTLTLNEGQVFNPEEGNIVPIAHTLVMFWIRDNEDSPEAHEFRVRLNDPNKIKSVSKEFKIDLKKFKKIRVNLKVPHVQVGGEGRYFYSIENKITKGDKISWKRVARIPFEVIIEKNPGKKKAN